MRLTLRGYNMPARVGRDAARREVRRVLEGADAVVWQEGVHVARHLDHIDGWRAVVLPDDRALPIALPARAKVTGYGSVRAYPDTPVGAWGAGPPTLRAAWCHAIRVQYGSREDRAVWIVDAHLAPSVTRRAVTPAARAGRERRRRLHQLEVDQLHQLTRRLDRVVVLADWNAPPHYPGMAPLRDGLVDAGATHGRHTYDYAFVKGVAPVDARVLRKGPSDHHPFELVVTD